MARASRPPGFDMTYRPAEEFFGPPLGVRFPSFVHVGVGVCVIALVFLVQQQPESELYDYMYRQPHFIDAHMLALAFAISSTASLLRSSMRGVRVRPDWVEYRDVISSLWPKVRRFRWAQIEALAFHESGSISLDLWDGRREFLPPVANQDGLSRVLLQLGRARAIPMKGAPEVDDLDEPYDPPGSELPPTGSKRRDE